MLYRLRKNTLAYLCSCNLNEICTNVRLATTRTRKGYKFISTGVYKTNNVARIIQRGVNKFKKRNWKTKTHPNKIGRR